MTKIYTKYTQANPCTVIWAKCDETQSRNERTAHLSVFMQLNGSAEHDTPSINTITGKLSMTEDNWDGLLHELTAKLCLSGEKTEGEEAQGKSQHQEKRSLRCRQNIVVSV